MASIKRLLILANHDNGYNLTNYFSQQKDAKIVKIVVYEDSKEQWWKSVKKLAIHKGIDHSVYSTDEELYKELKDLDVDLLFSINWGHKIPSKILKIPKLGSVNFHNSLLPKHRGVYANTWPILLGEQKSGVSLHWMSEDFDTGNIIYQESFEIDSWEDAKDVFEKINKTYLKMIKKMWPKVDKWKDITKPQEGESSYHSRRDYEATNHIDLDEKKRVGDFINFLRAKTFEPHYKDAFFIDPKTGKRVYISINLNADDRDR